RAAAELVRRYEPAVRRVARVRLGAAHLQRLLDSMDVCQSVFASFFVRAALGQFDLDTPEQLLKLLVSMSRRKVIDQVRGAGAAPPRPAATTAGSRRAGPTSIWARAGNRRRASRWPGPSWCRSSSAA